MELNKPDKVPIPVVARLKEWVWGLSLAGIVGSSPAGRGCLFIVSAVCCEVDVSAPGW